jgi:hypothetical protein
MNFSNRRLDSPRNCTKRAKKLGTRGPACAAPAGGKNFSFGGGRGFNRLGWNDFRLGQRMSNVVCEDGGVIETTL